MSQLSGLLEREQGIEGTAGRTACGIEPGCCNGLVGSTVGRHHKGYGCGRVAPPATSIISILLLVFCTSYTNRCVGPTYCSTYRSYILDGMIDTEETVGTAMASCSGYSNSRSSNRLTAGIPLLRYHQLWDAF